MKTPVHVYDSCCRSFHKRFPSKRAARDWFMSGLAACEGAEQEHYTHMLLQLEEGKTEIDYNGMY